MNDLVDNFNRSVTPLYSKGKKGEIRVWQVSTNGAQIIVEHGVLDGKHQTKIKLAKGKNIGRANETTPTVQAILQAKSMYRKQVDKGYFSTIEAARTTVVVLPMLAHSLKDHKNKVNYPCGCQPKLDGCLFRTSQISTDQGLMTIEDIVENKKKVNVLSFNEELKEYQFKPIVNWFKNGKENYKNWVEIVPEYGKHLKCTCNHTIFTDKGVYVRADTLDPKEDKILINTSNAYLNGLILGTLLGDSMLAIEKRGSGTGHRLKFSHTNKELFDFKCEVLNMEGTKKPYISGYGSDGFVFTGNSLHTDLPVNDLYYTGHHDKCGQRKLISVNTLRKHLTNEGLSLWIADDGSISYNNGNKRTPILSISTHNHSEQQIEEFLKYFDKEWGLTPSVYTDKRVVSTPGKFLTFSTRDTLYLLTFLRHYAAKGVEYKYFYPVESYIKKTEDTFSYGSFKMRNSRRMDSAEKYDIEVEDNHNYVANGILVHNCRMTVRWEDGKITLKSKGGKPYDIAHIASACSLYLPKDQAFDGEVYIHGVPLQKINSLVKRPQEESATLEYHVYDNFMLSNLDQPWEERARDLESLFEPVSVVSPIKSVPTTSVSSEEEALQAELDFVYEGYEGAILRDKKGGYELGNRSTNLLKVKSMDDDEFEVVGFLEGDGGTVIWQCTTKEGKIFKASPKGTMEQRRFWFQNGNDYIGRWFKVKFANYTPEGKPFHPIGLCFRLEEDM